MNDRAYRIRLCQPVVDRETIDDITDVLRSFQLSLGPRLESFEAAFSRRLGGSHAVAVSSGTAGLHLAVRLLGIGPGDEAITTPFSFIASANCLLFEGAQPVFVDIDPDYFTMDLSETRAAIHPATRLILPVHVFGNPVDMEAVLELAIRHGLSVIEDACEAVGGVFRGRALGTWGDLGVFGFYPNKQLTTGEGGMVVTARADWAERLRSLRNQGRSPAGDGSFTELGYNYRMSELSATLGEGQLRRLEFLLAARREREKCYQVLLGGLSEVRVPPIPVGRSPFVFIIQASSEDLRDRIRAHLDSRGIQTAVYFRPIHLEAFYRERFALREGQFPRAEKAGRTCLAIPFHPAITEAEQVVVAREIRASVESWLQGRVVAVGGAV